MMSYWRDVGTFDTVTIIYFHHTGDAEEAGKWGVEQIWAKRRIIVQHVDLMAVCFKKLYNAFHFLTQFSFAKNSDCRVLTFQKFRYFGIPIECLRYYSF